MIHLDKKAKREMEKELGEEVKGIKIEERIRLLTQCADYLLLEDKPLLRDEKRRGYSP